MPNAARHKRGPESVKTTDSAIPAGDCGVRMVCPGKLCALRGVGLGGAPSMTTSSLSQTHGRGPYLRHDRLPYPNASGQTTEPPPAEVLQDAGIDFAPDAGLDPGQSGSIK